ncbi:MAG: helix-turn-helix domain-containing protein [Cyclobacteriaceae bacterium]|nr:helix-turn-helix domain-containing protein [Cyclobacteriaceae bacterium]
MEITLRLLGERLKEIRKAMGMLQGDVAKHLDVNQNAISRIENGVGGGTDVLLGMINFYGKFYHVDRILTEKFEIVPITDTTGPMESVAIERLKLWQKEFNEEVGKIIGLLGEV